MENQPPTVDYVVNDPKAIYEIFKNLNINISFKDIKQPTIETYMEIYKAFLDICLMVKGPIHDEIPGDAITNFSDDVVKNQGETFKFLQLYSLITYFYSMMGLGYTMMEIFNPPKKLYYKQISSLINFARFLFDELNEYGVVQDRNKAYMEKCVTLIKECEDYDMKIETLQIEAKQKKPLIEATKKRIAALKEKQNKIRELKNKLTEKNDTAKKEEHSSSIEKNNYTDRVNSIQKKMDIYEMLLIKSPDRLRKNLEKNEARIIDLKKLSESKQCENEKLRQDVFERERFIEMVNGIKKEFENFYNNEVQRANAKLKDIEKVQEEITSLNFNLKELENLVDLTKRDKEHLEMDIQTKNQGFEQNRDKLSKEAEMIENKIGEILGQIQQIDEEFKRIQDEKNKAIKRCQEVMALSFKQTSIVENELNIVEAKFNAEKLLMFDYKKEILNKVDNLRKTEQSGLDFLDKAIEEFNRCGTILFENLKL